MASNGQDLYEPRRRMGRREFVRTGATAAAMVAAGFPFSLTACNDRRLVGSDPDRFAEAYREAVRIAERAGAPREVRLVAEEGEVDIGGRIARTFLYDGRMPGPEIRVREGERLRVTLGNGLPENTTIHWHGVPLPWAMDGVPHVTQEPVPPGGTFVYDFVAEPAGTYLYHSHAGLQLDTGLSAPLIFEESTPHVSYDREYTLMLQDFRPGRPEMPGGGMMIMGRGGEPEYEHFLVNGRPPVDPDTFDVSRGERVRIRLVNPSSSHAYRVTVAGHRMSVTHADAHPVEPVEVDALEIGQGERYDVLVTADDPGLWNIAAASLTGGPPPARAVLRYTGSQAAPPDPRDLPEGLRGGRLLSLDDLRSLAIDGGTTRRPDRVFDLTLRGGMGMMRDWTIDGQTYPDSDPLPISEGERVRVSIANMSMRAHPMHLHGHFFRVGDVLKETVMVPPHMGRRTFEFTADNPGDWFFHCHHLYHMEGGMARVLPYG